MIDWKKQIEKLGIKDEIVLVGIRGYYAGISGNARGVYDDALIWVNQKTGFVDTYRANTDPSGFRKGTGYGSSKGMAKLKAGLWYYKTGLHNDYAAFRQAADVIVIRDGNPPYEDKGQFGINIHCGSRSGGTSSLGCQTLPYKSWPQFKETGYSLIKKAKVKSFIYLLLEA
jgi:hypothetical protein